MSPSASLLLLLAAVSGARADAAARLQVTGSVATEDEELVVSVQVDNRGDAAVAPLIVHGELLGKYDEAQKETGVAARSWTEAQLRFPRDVPRPGVHVVALRLDYQSPPGGAWTSQAAYLLLALGANPPAAVRVFVGEAAVETRGRVAVELESADGRPHVAHLRLITPKGLNPFGEGPRAVEVPAQGRVWAALEVLRGSAPRKTRQGILVAAATSDGEAQTAAVAEGAVVIADDPAVLPRLRVALTVAAILTLLAAAGVEVRRRWPRAGAGSG